MGESSFCFDSPITNLTVTTDGDAVTRIEFGKHCCEIPKSHLERKVAKELEEYFAGTRRFFTFPCKAEGTDFNRSVWARVADIPYGRTRTYGEIARDLERPGAARAVGTANGRNPIPIVIPCHRVVGSGGRLVGFGGGLPLKRKLLDLECSNSPAMA